MTQPVLQISNLVCGYRSPLFLPFDLTLSPGSSVAITGRSGWGKTSILNTILGFINPISGTILVDGRDMNRMSYRDLARARSHTVGTIFQRGELLGGYTALENVALVKLLQNKRDTAAAGEATVLLESLEIEPSRLARDLSGGERQRVALARALITNPKLILADEPTGSLDLETRDDVMDRLMGLTQSQGTALIIVTHDLAVAERADFELRLRPAPFLEEPRPKAAARG